MGAAEYVNAHHRHRSEVLDVPAEFRQAPRRRLSIPSSKWGCTESRGLASPLPKLLTGHENVGNRLHLTGLWCMMWAAARALLQEPARPTRQHAVRGRRREAAPGTHIRWLGEPARFGPEAWMVNDPLLPNCQGHREGEQINQETVKCCLNGKGLSSPPTGSPLP